MLCGFTAFDLLLYRQHSAETSTLLYDFTFGSQAMSGIPTAVSLASFAIAVYVHRVLPRYTAHLAIAAAAVHPVLLAAFIVHDGPHVASGLLDHVRNSVLLVRLDSRNGTRDAT
ncbi:MAG: hypothetical protein WAM92_19505 [Mycobacterium sp.]